MQATKSSQSGVFLLEALIGILIFSIGVLALVAMGTTAISVQADAQYRTEAMNLAQRISSEIWTGVDRTKQTINGAEMSVVSTTSLLEYQNAPTLTSNCTFTGTASTKQVVLDWISAVRGTLPGSGSGMQQVKVSTGSSNQVSITICWQTPSDRNVRQYTLVTYVN
jgi:type IV pilus assembly protein PilV